MESQGVAYHDKIIDYLKKHAQRWVTVKELIQALQVDRNLRPGFRRFLGRLAQEGQLSRMRGNKYRIIRGGNLLEGRLSRHRHGYAFVIPERGGAADVFIPAAQVGDARHGDRVLVEMYQSIGRKNPEGRIIKIVERSAEPVLGVFERSPRCAWVHPRDGRVAERILIPSGMEHGAKDGQTVMVDLIGQPAGRQFLEGEIKVVLGQGTSASIEERAILMQHGLDQPFPRAALKQAEEIEKAMREGVPQSFMEGRKDLRGLCIVTIDGEKAKDFDDAVGVEPLPGGGYRLFISIADVGGVVPAGTPLDQEALARATSVYYPDAVIPMFPEPISNNVCSLRSGEDRLTLTVELEFDVTGHLHRRRFYESCIRSVARLTYTDVFRALKGEPVWDPALRERFLPSLLLMEKLAMLLRGKRKQRGSLDFDLPEAEFHYDEEGALVDVQRAPRNVAHELIEEFMLAANEAVAAHLTERRVPTLYRIHDKPDPAKIEEWVALMKELGYKLPPAAQITPRILNRLLEKSQDEPEGPIAHHLLLRCMKQARYSPTNIGHFGLASQIYTHFTSPIRRYPDLVVHRVLKKILTASESRSPIPPAELEKIALHASGRERMAMDVEREMADLRKAEFMQEHLGEELEGHVSHVTRFGFFVELDKWFLEGFVKVESIGDDYYAFEEKMHRLRGKRKRKTFKLGDAVSVQVVRASLEDRRVEFNLT